MAAPAITYADSHAHFPSGAAAVGSLVTEAVAAGVEEILAVGGSPTLNAAARGAAVSHPDHLRLALGYDRDQTATPVDAVVAELRTAAASSAAPLAAIGEIGLDYHYHSDNQRAQCQLMEAQLEVAASLNLPAIIHTREADADTLAILRNAAVGRGRPLGVVHCFTGTRDFAEALLEIGLYISFSGIVTFANAAPLRQVAAAIPAARLLIETDSPYLTPVPLRGRPNRPAYLIHVAACLAKVRGCEAATVAALTRQNLHDLLGLN